MIYDIESVSFVSNISIKMRLIIRLVHLKLLSFWYFSLWFRAIANHSLELLKSTNGKPAWMSVQPVFWGSIYIVDFITVYYQGRTQTMVKGIPSFIECYKITEHSNVLHLNNYLQNTFRNQFYGAFPGEFLKANLSPISLCNLYINR